MFPNPPETEWVYFWTILLAAVVLYTLYFAVTTYIKDKKPKISFVVDLCRFFLFFPATL
jgi:hypothetical protein